LFQTQRYLELLRVLVKRNLSVRYRGSIFGVFWSLLNPLIMTGLYTAIFGSIFAAEYDGSIFRYALAAFTGLIVINFFAATTTQSLVSVVSNGVLLNKIRLPISVFPISVNVANLIQFFYGPLPLLLVTTLIISKSLINAVALLLPLLALILVSLGVSFFVSSLYVFFRDLPYFYELVVFVLWISSPVFYPSKIVPPQVKPLLVLNPLSQIIESTRQIVLSGAPPDLGLIAGSVVGGLIIFGLGWSCFQVWRSQFMDLL